MARTSAAIIDLDALRKLPKIRRGKVTPAARKRSTRSKTGGGYPSYMFPGDYDPILDVVQAVIEYTELTLAEISRASGVSMSTLINYKNKYVLSPRHSTVVACLRACRASEYYKVGDRVFPVFGKLT